MSEPDYRAEMKLPDGRTCADCYAVRFCVGIGCTTAAATSCDYWPRRFRIGQSGGSIPGPAGVPSTESSCRKPPLPPVPNKTGGPA
jgi:hypothetical protein